MYYSGGILDSWDCTPNYSHAVVIVGFGSIKSKTAVNKSIEYFIIRNSWGTTWGEGGYARITASQDKFKQGMCNLYGDNKIAIAKDEKADQELIDEFLK